MVMTCMTAITPLSAGGALSEQGRRPTPVSAPQTTSPELLDRPRRRRTFTAADKLRILAEIDRAGPAATVPSSDASGQLITPHATS